MWLKEQDGGEENIKVKGKCKFNLKHRECLYDHPSQRLMTKVPDVQIEL